MSIEPSLSVNAIIRRETDLNLREKVGDAEFCLCCWCVRLGYGVC